MAEAQEIQEQLELNDWPEGGPSRAIRLIGENLKQLPELDGKKVKTGYVLYLILNDDMGPFGGASFLLKSKSPERAPLQRRDMIRRIDWELQQKSTPRTIRSLLEKVKGELGNIEWNTAEEIERAFRIWENRVFTNVGVMVDNNLNGLGDDYREYKRYEDIVHSKKLPH